MKCNCQPGKREIIENDPVLMQWLRNHCKKLSSFIYCQDKNNATEIGYLSSSLYLTSDEFISHEFISYKIDRLDDGRIFSYYIFQHSENKDDYHYVIFVEPMKPVM